MHFPSTPHIDLHATQPSDSFRCAAYSVLSSHVTSILLRQKYVNLCRTQLGSVSRAWGLVLAVTSGVISYLQLAKAPFGECVAVAMECTSLRQAVMSVNQANAILGMQRIGQVRILEPVTLQ